MVLFGITVKADLYKPNYNFKEKINTNSQLTQENTLNINHVYKMQSRTAMQYTFFFFFSLSSYLRFINNVDMLWENEAFSNTIGSSLSSFHFFLPMKLFKAQTIKASNSTFGNEFYL